MSFTEGSGGSSSPESVALGEILSFFGNIADHAAGRAVEDGERIAALAVGMARLAGLDSNNCDALYFAARLRNSGVLGNEAFAKGDQLSERAAMTARWDVPAQGARICENIGALPRAVCDIVRWQAEGWDGTGFPDQLRWSGIPMTAQLLHIAATYVASTDPDEALAAISSESGRAFGPDSARSFVMWFHTFGGRIEPVETPDHALLPRSSTPLDIVTMLSDLVDQHNGTPGRAKRVADHGIEIARALELDQETVSQIRLASLLYGIGELRAAVLESGQFDALARLGIEARAAHAMRAAELIAQCRSLAGIAPIVRARGEWYDGTGSPDALKHDAIPVPSSVLATSIAYDALDEAFHARVSDERALPNVRIETASGTQFEPKVVRALTELLKTRA